MELQNLKFANPQNRKLENHKNRKYIKSQMYTITKVHNQKISQSINCETGKQQNCKPTKPHNSKTIFFHSVLKITIPLQSYLSFICLGFSCPQCLRKPTKTQKLKTATLKNC